MERNVSRHSICCVALISHELFERCKLFAIKYNLIQWLSMLNVCVSIACASGFMLHFIGLSKMPISHSRQWVWWERFADTVVFVVFVVVVLSIAVMNGTCTLLISVIKPICNYSICPGKCTMANCFNSRVQHICLCKLEKCNTNNNEKGRTNLTK